jgi:hypothetical protein
VDAVYFEVASTAVVGWTQRVSLDLSASPFAPGDVYVSTTGPVNPITHFTLFEGTSTLTTADGPPVSLDWGVYGRRPITNHFGVPHVPLGDAALSVEGGDLVVSNLGAGGEDGVRSVLVPGWSVGAGLDAPPGASLSITPWLALDGGPDPHGILGSLELSYPAGLTPGWASLIKLPEIPGETEVQIFDDGQLVRAFPGRRDPEVTFGATPEYVAFQVTMEPVFVSRFIVSADTDFQIDGGLRVRGDEVHFLTEAVTLVVERIERWDVQVDRAPQISISDMSFTPTCPGDLDGDLSVALPDLTTLLANFGRRGEVLYVEGDLNLDGAIDLTDLAFELTQFGQRCE